MFGALWKRIFGKTNAPEQEPALPPYDPLAALRDQVWRDVAGAPMTVRATVRMSF